MLKNLIIGATCITVSPAAVAATPSVTAEVTFSDPRGGSRTDAAEYRIEYNDSVSVFNYGLEVEARQNSGAGTLGTEISAKVGPSLPSFLGVTSVAYGEIGTALKTGRNYEFWGLGVDAYKKLYGPVSVVVGYRHRESFANRYKNQERLSGGLTVDMSDNYAVAAQYYRTRGTLNSDGVGVAVTRKF